MNVIPSYIAPDMFEPSPGAWPFGGLEPQAYDLIMIDPPWRFELYSDKGEEKSAQAHYRTMSLEEIAALPVADLARPDCLLWLWATAPLLPAQINIMARWGFAYKTSGAWVKRTKKSGDLAFGTGYVLRGCHETFLIGARGKPKLGSKSVRSVIEAPAREHSRKPDAAYRAAEALMPAARRADVFSRETRAGWEASGDETGKFDIEPLCSRPDV